MNKELCDLLNKSQEIGGGRGLRAPGAMNGDAGESRPRQARAYLLRVAM